MPPLNSAGVSRAMRLSPCLTAPLTLAARRTATMPRARGSLFSFCVEVFVLGRVVVLLVFRWRCGFRSLRFVFASRSAAARWLWRFRAARRWWRSSSAPPRSVVVGSVVPRFGLRWLAARKLSLFSWSVVPRPGCRPVFRSLLPSARVRRPCPRACVGR